MLWHDFMTFQMGQMPGMNEGVAYLATVSRENINLNAVVVLAAGQIVPPGPFTVIDLGGRTIDKRCIFLITAKSGESDTCSFHKIGMTLPITGEYEELIESLPLEAFSIGGDNCQTCSHISMNIPVAGSWTVSRSRSLVIPQRTPKTARNPWQKKKIISPLLYNKKLRSSSLLPRRRQLTKHNPSQK